MTPSANVITGPERAWNRQFDRLVEFHRTQGHFKIPRQGDYESLYEWFGAQCLLKRFNHLRPDRQQRLEALGFDWDRHRHIEEQSWERHFHQLVEFHQTHGHFEIPKQSPTAGLHDWVRNQRQLQRSGQLSVNRRQRLEALGFAWLNPRGLSEQAWNGNFARLMEYHQTHGHFRVPDQMPGTSGLRRWIGVQRVLHRLHRLRPDRQQRLEAVGFIWETPHQRKLAEKRRQALREPLLK